MTTLKMRGAFWTGSTGRAIRALPNHKDVRILASYLVTSPAANLYGLYPLNLDVVSLESGLTLAEAAAAFKALAELDFAHYDPSGWVWVVEMAAQQLNTPLKPGDYMMKNASRWYAGLPNNPFLGPFWTRYQDDLWNDDTRPAERAYVPKRGSGRCPFHPPSKGHRCPDLDQIRRQIQISSERSARPCARRVPRADRWTTGCKSGSTGRSGRRIRGRPTARTRSERSRSCDQTRLCGSASWPRWKSRSERCGRRRSW